MSASYYQFEDFCLYLDERQLRHGGERVELNARYFDALRLLIQESGKLVTRERFFNDVWHGIPVTDEALTQCIKTLRKQLGDNATRPRFIETVPKHGYRFIAEVQRHNFEKAPTITSTDTRSDVGRQVVAGSLGGALAGSFGALLLAAGGLVQAPAAAIGSISALLVMIFLCTAIAVLGAAGVSFALAAARRMSGSSLASCVLGAAFGGMLTGAAGQLIGGDAFTVLLGRSPGDITGAAEGFVVGASVGLGFWLSSRKPSAIQLALLNGMVCGAIAGGLIILCGGELMSGSLHALVQSFPESRLQMDNLGVFLGEGGFGPWTRTLTGMVEGAVFAMFVVSALWWSLPCGNQPTGN